MRSSAVVYEEVREFCPERILQYYADKEHLPLAEARERWDEMLKFLVLCVTSEKVHAPSAAVDGAWHAFLMHTQEYEAFCLEKLGRFIHHNPKPEPVEEFQNSLEEIFMQFPNAPARRHLWLKDYAQCDYRPDPGPPGVCTAQVEIQAADCDHNVCIGICAERGCSRVSVLRTEKLPSVVAFSAA